MQHYVHKHVHVPKRRSVCGTMCGCVGWDITNERALWAALQVLYLEADNIVYKLPTNMSFTTTHYTVPILIDWLID